MLSNNNYTARFSYFNGLFDIYDPENDPKHQILRWHQHQPSVFGQIVENYTSLDWFHAAVHVCYLGSHTCFSKCLTNIVISHLLMPNSQRFDRALIGKLDCKSFMLQ